MQIEIWSDVVCPWCYLAKRRFESALSAVPYRDDVEIIWRSYQLDPTLAKRFDGGERRYLVERKRMMLEQVDAVLAHVSREAAVEGLTYDFDRLIVANSRTAHRVLQVAGRADRATATVLVEAVFSAHFERGLDIGDERVLTGLAEDAELTADAVRDGLADPEIEAAVERDIATAREYGIGGVPFFVLDDTFAVSGAQPVEVFAKALAQARERSAEPPA